MKEKMHLAILSLGICTLIGMTFAISSRDYKEKSPKLNSGPETTTSSRKFVCSAEAISDSSQATKEYNKNLDKWQLLSDKIKVLIEDNGNYEDPCEGLKGKEKTECNINNVELRGVLRQIKIIKEKLVAYEECEKKLGLGETERIKEGNETGASEEIRTTSERKEGVISIKKCGLIDVTEDVKTGQRKILKCISDAILECTPASIDFIDPNIDDISTYTVHKKDNGMCSIGVSVDNVDYRCNMPTQLIEDLKKSSQKKNEDLDLIISPIALLISKQGGINPETGKKITLSCKDHSKEVSKTAKWSEGEWPTCKDEKQTRKVECQLNGKKVDDKKCEGKKPITYQKCTSENNLGDTDLSKNTLYGPWVALTQSYTVNIGDLVQFTSDKGGDYVYSCGKDGTKTISQLNPEGEKFGTFYCVYSSLGGKVVTISYKGKIVSSKTFIVKEKVEQSTKKTDQKKYKCVDTDGGLDYSKQGSVTGIWDTYVGDVSDPMYTDTHTDMCLNNYGTTNGLPIGLLEHSCNSQGRKTENHYECPKGCKDGACVK